MTLPDNDVDLLEEAFRLITRYQETRDAALVDDAHVCEDWLARCFARLAERRIIAEAETPRTDPLARIAALLEGLMGETDDGTPFLRVVTGDKR